MTRYLFLAPYSGDPTAGYDFALVAPFDCSELVQPSVGDLYPPAPADTVLVWAYCQEHDRLTSFLAEFADDPTLAANIAMLEASMADGLAAMQAEYTYVGAITYA